MIKRARADRRAPPDKIVNAPQLFPGNGFIFQSFLLLSSCRPVGMGEGRIPWTAAYQYAQELDLTTDEFEDLWILISNMDAVYLKFRSDQAEQKQKAIRAANAAAGQK